MRVAERITEEAVESEDQQHHSSGQLEVEFIHRIIDEVEHKTQTDTSYQSVYKIADGGPNPCDEPIPAPFLLRALNTKDACGTMNIFAWVGWILSPGVR